MGGRKLARNVTALDEEGRMVTFPAGTTVSAKVAEGITFPNAFESSGSEDEAPKTTAKKTVAKKS